MSRAPRAVVLVLAGLAALYGAGWTHLSARFEEAVALWLDARGAEGVVITRAGIARGGFPFRLEARLIDPSVRFAAGGEGWTWTPSRAAFSAAPWALDRIRLDLSGDHAVFAGASPAAGPRWTASAQTLAITARLDGSSATEMTLVGAGLAVEDREPGGRWGAADVAARWRLATPPPADHRGESQSFELSAERVRLPERARPPLGPEIARLKLAGRVMGRLASLRPGMGAGALGPWRDDGGTVEIDALAVRYGALDLAGEGTLALDGAMQPVAALAARIEGFAEAIDALRERGVLARRDALTAKMVLAALATRGADGRPSLVVPLTLQDGLLSAGPAGLLRVPPIPW